MAKYRVMFQNIEAGMRLTPTVKTFKSKKAAKLFAKRQKKLGFSIVKFV